MTSRQPTECVATVDWGRLDYASALTRQRALVRSRRTGEVADTIVCVEHPPTISLGRNASDDDVLIDAAARDAAGLTLVRSDRGGQATYHGPGQAVVYPVVDIGALRLGAKAWVAILEDALVATLAGYGIEGRLECKSPGVWTATAEPAKIASIGLRINRGISYHGVSLNVDLEAGAFDCIVTCGVASERVTGTAAETGTRPSVADVYARFSEQLTPRLEKLHERWRPDPVTPKN